MGCVLSPNDLRLVVLAWGFLRADPHLDSVAVVCAAEHTEIIRHEAAQGVRHLLE